MPNANKAKNVFESGKTTSYDIKSVVAVLHSGKNSASFKLVVPRDAERHKRYEFEAETPKLAGGFALLCLFRSQIDPMLARQLRLCRQSVT